MKKFISCFTTVSLFFLSQTFYSQDSLEFSKATDKWSFIVEPYLMFPNMNGTTGLGNLPDLDVNAQPQDIFDNLQMGAMLSAEASKNKWHIGIDFIYMNLKQDVNPEGTVVNGKVNAKQLAYNVTGLYTLTSWLDVGLGGNLNSIKLESEVNINIGGTTTQNYRSGNETWFDPMLVARTQNKPNSKFIYQVRADIGGFGIGSDFAYQLQFYAGYRISK